MPKYSARSAANLADADPDLQTLFNEVVRSFDNAIVCGYRGQAEQDWAFAEKKSKFKFPMSKHNRKPAQAVDSIPYPLDWTDRERMAYYAGWVMAIAERLYLSGKMSHRVRWGGDWDRDTQIKDETFLDFPHFELI